MSINSGKAIINACEKLGYNVQGFDGFDELILDQKFDFIFLALHGKVGEDGTHQTQPVGVIALLNITIIVDRSYLGFR